VSFVDVFDERPRTEVVELEAGATSLDFLRQVYRNASLPLSTRMRAAGMALPHEHPKLGVSVNIPWNEEMAVRLEQAIERSSRVIEHPPKIIEHQPSEMKVIEPRAQSQLSGPVGPVPDRRFRRA
jgi:hypothetical protein